MKREGLLVTLVLALGALLPSSLTADAAQPPTPFPTPTPNEQGQIIYVVQEGDTLWRIAALAGISVEELMALNGIQSGDILSTGAELLIGAVEPTAAPESRLTPTPSATPPPLVGTGEICVMLFLDENGNASLDETEGPLPQGQISVIDREGILAGEHTTSDDPEGYCFVDLSDGDYNVSAAVPPDYNPTTAMNAPVRLRPGDVHHVQFGAQPSAALRATNGDQDGDQSVLLGIVGLALLGLAGVLGYYAVQMGRQRPTLGR